MGAKSWLSLVLLFLAWGFVMHGSGLLLHEFGGHALAATVLACGIDGARLTFFGHGQVSYPSCERWTEASILVTQWAGLAITTAAGLAALLLRRRGKEPLTRLLFALVAYFFLLGQLGYATSGGFHGLYDPGRSARWLGRRGLHVLAWLPPLVGYAAAALFGARAAVDAFREHCGSRSRLQTVRQIAATLGVAGVLYFAAFRIEWQLRTDLAMRGVASEAARVATERHGPPPFPIELVLTGIAFVALVAALARPVRAPTEPSPLPRRIVFVVAGATVAAFLALVGAMRVSG